MQEMRVGRIESKQAFLFKRIVLVFVLILFVVLTIPNASLGRGKRHQEGNTSGRRGRRKRQGETFNVQELDMHVYMFSNMLSAMQFGSHIKEREPCSQQYGRGMEVWEVFICLAPRPHPAFHHLQLTRVWGEPWNYAINMEKGIII